MARALILAIKKPERIENIFNLSETGRRNPSELLRETLDHISRQPGFMELYQGNFNPPLPSLPELLSYPPGSLGLALGRHLEKYNLKTDFYPLVKGNAVQEYVIRRTRQTHDLWHVLAKFGADIPGEVGVQAFMLAQLRSPFSALLVVVGILHSIIYKPKVFHAVIESMFEGYRMGRECQPLIGLKLEEWLEENLEHLRLRLGIQIKENSVLLGEDMEPA
jgi:ubiquinone biosynthesis protein Coq4